MTSNRASTANMHPFRCHPLSDRITFTGSAFLSSQKPRGDPSFWMDRIEHLPTLPMMIDYHFLNSHQRERELAAVAADLGLYGQEVD